MRKEELISIKKFKYTKLNFNLKRIIFEFLPFFTLSQSVYILDKSSKSTFLNLNYVSYLKANLEKISKYFTVSNSCLNDFLEEFSKFNLNQELIYQIFSFIINKKFKLISNIELLQHLFTPNQELKIIVKRAVDHSNFTKLDFSYKELKTYTKSMVLLIKLIVKFPNYLPNLKELNLEGNIIEKEEMEYLKISKLPKLKKLNLSKNPIGDEGMIFMKDFKFTKLQDLNLSCLK